MDFAESVPLNYVTTDRLLSEPQGLFHGSAFLLKTFLILLREMALCLLDFKAFQAGCITALNIEPSIPVILISVFSLRLHPTQPLALLGSTAPRSTLVFGFSRSCNLASTLELSSGECHLPLQEADYLLNSQEFFCIE